MKVECDIGSRAVAIDVLVECSPTLHTGVEGESNVEDSVGAVVEVGDHAHASGHSPSYAGKV